MGKGDPKTKKGKRYRGSFGNTRPSKPKKKSIVAAAAIAVADAPMAKASKKKA